MTCWGTRGSIPSPGPATAHYGGNTSCVEVRGADGRLYVLDAGTGIRTLGRRLAADPGHMSADLFMTHFHWDHIQGIPFFAPLYDAEATLRIHGPRQQDTDIEALFAQQMTPTYFPVPFQALAATMQFRHLETEPWSDGRMEVASMRVRHPGNTHGYRLSSGGASVAYVPDDELSGDIYDTGADWYDTLVQFLGDVDLLIHDAMYTDDELPQRRGWGHSTMREAVRLARDAGVGRLILFHHAPDRSDAELSHLLEGLQRQLAADGASLDVVLAAEGEEHLVREPQP